MSTKHKKSGFRPVNAPSPAQPAEEMLPTSVEATESVAHEDGAEEAVEDTPDGVQTASPADQLRLLSVTGQLPHTFSKLEPDLLNYLKEMGLLPAIRFWQEVCPQDSPMYRDLRHYCGFQTPADQFVNMLLSHDWWHDYSDDSKVALAGADYYKAMVAMGRSLPVEEATALWEEFAPSEFACPYKVVKPAVVTASPTARPVVVPPVQPQVVPPTPSVSELYLTMLKAGVWKQKTPEGEFARLQLQAYAKQLPEGEAVKLWQAHESLPCPFVSPKAQVGLRSEIRQHWDGATRFVDQAREFCGLNQRGHKNAETVLAMGTGAFVLWLAWMVLTADTMAVELDGMRVGVMGAGWTAIAVAAMLRGFIPTVVDVVAGTIACSMFVVGVAWSSACALFRLYKPAPSVAVQA